MMHFVKKRITKLLHSVVCLPAAQSEVLFGHQSLVVAMATSPRVTDYRKVSLDDAHHAAMYSSLANPAIKTYSRTPDPDSSSNNLLKL